MDACLGRRYIAPALCEFMREYPDIEVEVDIADRHVNLQEDGYDVAIRTGKTLEWDGPGLKVTNYPEANQLIQTEYRRGWEVTRD